MQQSNSQLRIQRFEVAWVDEVVERILLDALKTLERGIWSACCCCSSGFPAAKGWRLWENATLTLPGLRLRRSIASSFPPSRLRYRYIILHSFIVFVTCIVIFVIISAVGGIIQTAVGRPVGRTRLGRSGTMAHECVLPTVWWRGGGVRWKEQRGRWVVRPR